MRKLMVLVVLLAVALIAAPAIAENGGESTTPDTPPSDGPGPSLLEPPLSESSAEEPPPQIDTTPEPSPAPGPPPALEPPPPAPEPPPVLDPPVSEPVAPEPPARKNEGPVSDTSADGTPPTLDNVASPSPDVADSPDDRASDDDESVKDERADDVRAEAREDRIADRLFAQLRDRNKSDDDKDDEDDEENDVEQNQDQDADSGDVDQDADVINTGDNVNQCVGILQVANTGNAQNATGINQFDSETDEVELEDGSRITLTPQLVVDCRQIILQIVRGERPNESNLSRARLREVVRPTSGVALANRSGAGVVVPSGRSGIAATPKVLSASSAGRPVGQQLRASASRSLPRTGGSYATLLGLGAGALLIGGGLVVRRLAK